MTIVTLHGPSLYDTNPPCFPPSSNSMHLCVATSISTYSPSKPTMAVSLTTTPHAPSSPPKACNYVCHALIPHRRMAGRNVSYARSTTSRAPSSPMHPCHTPSGLRPLTLPRSSSTTVRTELTMITLHSISSRVFTLRTLPSACLDAYATPTSQPQARTNLRRAPTPASSSATHRSTKGIAA